jgi:hypothetical protein
VGAEIACSARIGRKSVAGKALLEAHEIIFRGDGARVVIPLAEISALDAAGGKLKLTYPGGTVIFEIGPQAEAWAEKIRNPKSVLDKLGVQPGQRAVLLRVPDAALAEQLRERGVMVSTRLVRDADVIFLGAETLPALAGLRQTITYMKRDGALWTLTPKGKDGIKDTDVMGIAKAAGLVAVKVVGYSATHSANKFVIPKTAR